MIYDIYCINFFAVFDRDNLLLWENELCHIITFVIMFHRMFIILEIEYLGILNGAVLSVPLY